MIYRLLGFVTDIKTKTFLVDMFEYITDMKAEGKWLKFLNASQVYLFAGIMCLAVFLVAANPKVLSKILGIILIAILAIFFLNLFGLIAH